MKVKFLMIAEVDIGKPRPGQDPVGLAQQQMDAFRESETPSASYGICFYRISRNELDEQGIETDGTSVEER